MTLQLCLVCLSIALLVLSAILVVLFTGILRNLVDLVAILRKLRMDVAPVIDDILIVSRHAVAVSEAMRAGMSGVSRLTDAVGNIGADLEEGRKSVKGGMKLLAELLGPLFGRTNG